MRTQKYRYNINHKAQIVTAVFKRGLLDLIKSSTYKDIMILLLLMNWLIAIFQVTRSLRFGSIIGRTREWASRWCLTLMPLYEEDDMIVSDYNFQPFGIENKIKLAAIPPWWRYVIWCISIWTLFTCLLLK